MRLLKVSRMGKLALFVANFLIILVLAPIQYSYAGSIGSSPCASTVTTTSTTSVVYSGGKCYIIFKSGSNAWTAPTGLSSVSLLVIGGGGAGGSGAGGGGGGAGGIVWDTSFAVTPLTPYSLVVGDSGTPGTNSLTPGGLQRSNNGGDSWFNSNTTMVAKGGGAGASYGYSSSDSTYCDGVSGGSGGGATECFVNGHVNAGGSSTQTLPTGADLIFANTGGITATNSYQAGGGGGGSGSIGTASSSYQVPGAGGAGTQYFKPLLTAIASAMPTAWQETTTAGYIAGGGGGASSTSALGGVGGGGAGGANTVNSSSGANGVANTGSGGGGASCCSPNGFGGYGGSGLIVIQYAANLSTSVSIAAAGSATTATYRSPILITATTVGNNANVKFYQNGKVIPGCQSVPSSGFQATCSFRPAQKGTIVIKAVLVAANGYLSSTSLPVTLVVTNRSGKR